MSESLSFEFEDHKNKTKLEKFLDKIDSDLLDEINEYIERHLQLLPQKKQGKRKGGIKLIEDMIIIRQVHQEYSSKKKYRKTISKNVYQELSKKIDCSTTTIKERINKKLCNITMEDLRYHIRMGNDITFSQKHKIRQEELFMEEAEKEPEKISSELDKKKEAIQRRIKQKVVIKVTKDGKYHYTSQQAIGIRKITAERIQKIFQKREQSEKQAENLNKKEQEDERNANERQQQVIKQKNEEQNGKNDSGSVTQKNLQELLLYRHSNNLQDFQKSRQNPIMYGYLQWSEEEDILLKEAISKKEAASIKMLYKYKTEEKVKERAVFLQLGWFEFND